ncbi:MAG: sugar ABC transporter permease [Silicimonas sp.]|nr:sugar ABC transporter permease [Silicimonas sp.]
MPTDTTISQPGAIPAGVSRRERLAEWVDRNSGTFFIAPAVTLILIFAIFPTIYSIFFALSRVRFTSDGLQFRFVGLRNFSKQFFGSSEVHFLGRTDPVSLFGYACFAAVVIAVLYWWIRSFRTSTWVGMLGRTISAAMAIFLSWILCASLLSGNSIGTLYTTLFYVIIGCGIQFVIGTGLAFLCSQPISGKNFFRVIFFIPLMITPLGVGYAMRMVADVTKGPFEPLLQAIGLSDWVWSADAWSARFMMMVSDSWQWIPFIFICMLAALENIPRDHVEAAQVDGASSVQIFREITWPQVLPVAVSVLLIRMIEAFKIVDLPNIMTGGGPGSATESMTLHSMYIWRANDFGQSAAIAYLLLLLTVVTCASFFNYVVMGQIRKARA